MFYDDLRRRIFAACACDFVLDAVGVPPWAMPYIERIEKGENIRSVLYDFVNDHIEQKTFTVNIRGVKYPVVLKPKIRDKLVSGTKGRDISENKDLAERLIVGLANLDEILVNGEKSRLVETGYDPKGRHVGSKWIYVRDVIDDPKIQGSVIVHLEFRTSLNEGNRVYHMTASGGRRYEDKEKIIERNLALFGEIQISV